LKRVAAILVIIIFAAGAPLLAAPLCILNQSGQTLLLVVDDLAQNRVAQTTVDGSKLCLEVAGSVNKAMVGVFADSDAQEGCSRLSKPPQTETLTDFVEFDRCTWLDTPRLFPSPPSN